VAGKKLGLLPAPIFNIPPAAIVRVTPGLMVTVTPEFTVQVSPAPITALELITVLVVNVIEAASAS